MSKRILKGKVVSSKNDKTIIVEVTRTVQHKLYKKIIKRKKDFMHMMKIMILVSERMFLFKNQNLFQS